MKKIDVLIIGAGAAGLMCALTAAKRGRKVFVIDHANKPGKKILMSGGGRCNFTNTNTSPSHFISHNPDFCKSALSRYTPQNFIDLVNQHTISFHEKTLGQLFCDHKSQDILSILLKECELAQVTLQMSTSVKQISAATPREFFTQTTQGDFQSQALVIATGGLSIPTMGATPFGYKVAEQFGINVWPTRAGLVPFTLHTHDKEKFACLSGVAVDALVSCNHTHFRENLLFTHRGLSGPAMLQISSYWHPGDTLTINLLPDLALDEILYRAKSSSPHLTLKNILDHYLPKRIVSVWLGADYEDKTLQSCTQKLLKSIAESFQEWRIKPNATEGYRTAEVTLGGVDCNAISSKTFETHAVPGLYFIGEVLDVTGWLGGYNFQWAWASAYAAGQVV